MLIRWSALRIGAPWILPLALLACDDGGGEPERVPDAAVEADLGWGAPDDVLKADTLAEELADHTAWTELTEGYVQGFGALHASWQRIFQNGDDAGAAGYIIVKRSYDTPDEDALAQISVMKRIPGYAPDQGDWFFAAFEPSFELATDGNSRPLAGRIARGSNEGCVPCHDGAPGGDFLFSVDAADPYP